MNKILAIAAISFGLATSAMAAGGATATGGAMSVSPSTNPTGTDKTVTNSTTGVNGANGAVGANSSNSSTSRTGTKCAEGGADATKTGTVTANPQTSSGGNGSGSCQ